MQTIKHAVQYTAVSEIQGLTRRHRDTAKIINQEVVKPYFNTLLSSHFLSQHQIIYELHIIM